jgi:hypothetical protein
LDLAADERMQLPALDESK